MKYCYECGRMTAGEPRFCNFCGRSYDVKLCPRLHVNPRIAEACSQCGSRDFSTPQPRVPIGWRLLAFLVRVAVGGLLILVALVVVLGFLKAALTTPELQKALVALGILLAVFWWLWITLPDWLRKAICRLLKKREGRNGN